MLIINNPKAPCFFHTVCSPNGSRDPLFHAVLINAQVTGY